MQDGQVYKNLWYDARFNNAKCVALSDNAQVRTMGANSGSVWYVQKGNYVTLTGYYYNEGSSSIIYAQTTQGLYAVIDLDNSAFELTANSNKLNKTAADAQKIIDKLIDNNKHIVSNNLLCARFAAKLTKAEKQQLYELQTRLEQRNEALQDEDYIQSATTSTPAGYSQLQAYLTQFMESGGVGSVTAAIVIAVVLIATTSTAAYFAYKYYYDESEQDVRFSDELTKKLMAKLTPEEYEQLKRETQGIVTKASLKARLKGSISWLAIAALAVGGLLLIRKRG